MAAVAPKCYKVACTNSDIRFPLSRRSSQQVSPCVQRARGLQVAKPPAGSQTTGSAQLAHYHLPCACSAPKGLQVAGPDREVYSLSRYYANWTLPRPESYAEDVQSAAGMTPDAQAQLWRNLASGAESGGLSLLQTLRRAGDECTEPCWAT